jgi:broad specificity phosphatase PhoE
MFVIRHGETSWSLSGQHTSTTELPLTENGRRRAERLRPVLAQETFAGVFVSPLAPGKPVSWQVLVTELWSIQT